MSELIGAKVELTGPDGMVYRFRYGASIPYAGEEYAVLLSEEGDGEEILITRVEAQENTLAFSVVEEDDVVDQVWSKYCDWKIRLAVQDLPEEGEAE
ncbi:MAG: DUF1292 domain-containing protein [Clostridia bacterium]|nr:DUF1292 domain-containing protein [Clostridia bacterium]